MDQHIQNPQLRDVIERWMIAALPSLKMESTRPTVLPRFDRIGMSVFIFSPALRGPAALPETDELLDAIMQVPEFVSRDGQPADGDEREVQAGILATKSVIAAFALEYLRESTSDEFEPELFASLYTDLKTYLYRFDDIRVRMTIDLWNVEAESAPIILSGGAVIRPLTDGEKAQFLRRLPQLAWSLALLAMEQQTPAPKLLIEFECNAGELTTREVTKPYVVQIGVNWEAREVGNRVLLALRLLNQGDVWLGFREGCFQEIVIL